MVLRTIGALCFFLVAAVFFAGETVRPVVPPGIHLADHRYSSNDPFSVQSTSGLGSHDLVDQHGDFSHLLMAQSEDFTATRQHDGTKPLRLWASPQVALSELRATHLPVNSTRAIVASTFMVRGESGTTGKPGTGGEVFVDLAPDLASNQVVLSEASLRHIAKHLNVTASVFVGDDPEVIDGKTGYPVRWYSSSGKEYVVCGHGTLATGVLAARLGVPATNTNTIPGGYPLLQANGHKEIYFVDIVASDREKYADANLGMGSLKDYEAKMKTTLNETNTNRLKPLLAQLLQTDEGQIENKMVSVEDDEHAMALIFFVTNLDELKAPALDENYAVVTPSGKKYRGLLAVTKYGGRLAATKNCEKSFCYRAFYPLLDLPEDKATGSANAFITTALKLHSGEDGPFTSQQRKGGMPTGEFHSHISDGSNDDEKHVIVGGLVQFLQAINVQYFIGDMELTHA